MNAIKTSTHHRNSGCRLALLASGVAVAALLASPFVISPALAQADPSLIGMDTPYVSVDLSVIEDSGYTPDAVLPPGVRLMPAPGKPVSRLLVSPATRAVGGALSASGAFGEAPVIIESASGAPRMPLPMVIPEGMLQSHMDMPASLLDMPAPERKTLPPQKAVAEKKPVIAAAVMPPPPPEAPAPPPVPVKAVDAAPPPPPVIVPVEPVPEPAVVAEAPPPMPESVPEPAVVAETPPPAPLERKVEETPPPPPAPEPVQIVEATPPPPPAPEPVQIVEATPEPSVEPEPMPAPAEQAALTPPGDPLQPGHMLGIIFSPEASKLPVSMKAELKAIAQKLSQQDGFRLQLLAYAGGTGLSASAARRLSLSRALEVRSYLIENGVRSTRIDVRALGNKTTEPEPNRVDVNVIER